ncbi:MAG: YbaB/EbfC family nucleoid-associated protein [Ferruginibacter sp.]|nr:YbaB/EbfC family nucleoid-associated protein [Cytophagales bacterium]
MFDMMNMLGKVKELQAKMKEAQDNLEHLIETAESGAGMVKVTVNGKKQVIRLEIDPDLIKPEDRQVLQDLVVAAINKAITNVEEKAKEELKKSTQGLLPNIPGFDLSSLV